MELIYVFIILSVDFSYIMLATDKNDLPTDVRIDIIDDTAIISWKVPNNYNRWLYFSRIRLNNSKDGDLVLDLERQRQFKDILVPLSSFKIANLSMCSEYTVKIQLVNMIYGYSEFTTQNFWMTNTTFTAEIDENVTLSWRTSLTPVYKVRGPTNTLFLVQFGTIVPNYSQRKYIANKFDDTTLDESTLNITVMNVKKTDAGLYGSVDLRNRNRNMNRCCILVVTTKPMNPILTIAPEHPFVNDNITLTCNSTVQRWPVYISSNLSYQYYGNPRGYTNNNTLILNKLTKSDKDINISCQAIDELGKVSNMSQSIILDPYYGPDKVLVNPEYKVINVTKGSKLGPIHCTANCYPNCKFNWKFSTSRHFELLHSNPILTVADIEKNQSGIYRCIAVHPYDKTIMKMIDLVVNVQYSSQIRELWLSDKIETNEWSNATIYSFSEDVNLKIRLSIDSNPDPQLVLSTSLITFPPLHYTKSGLEFLSDLPALQCEDSGNYTIQASNGIKYGDARTVNLVIYCKPRNVRADFKMIKTKVNTTVTIVIQVVSFPKPTVHWTRSTVFVWMVQKDRKDFRYRMYSSIHIDSEDDFGDYGIHVCNIFGCILENITVTLEDDVEAVTNEYTAMFAAGITTLVVGVIVLIPGTIFVIRKCVSGLRTSKKISVESDEYIEVHRSIPVLSEPYSTLQPQPESRPLQEPSNDTYEECEMTTAVDIYQNVEEDQGRRKNTNQLMSAEIRI